MNNIEYTERQKRILASVGLESDPMSLTTSQRMSIEAIERMLSYLENKYNRTFQYLGYSNGLMEEEWLTAVAEGEDKRSDVVTVIPEEDGFADDYLWVYIRRLYDIFLEEALKERTGFDKIVVFTRNGGTLLNEVDVLSIDQMIGKCYGNSAVLVFSQDKNIVKDVADSFVKVCRENRFWGSSVVVGAGEENKGVLISRNNYDQIVSRAKVRFFCKLDRPQ